MREYIIRTSYEDKKTYIFQAGQNPEIIGIAYTDFNIDQKTKDIRLEDIVKPISNRIIARLNLFNNNNIISVYSKNKIISKLTQEETYKEDNIIIPYSKLTKQILLSKKEYKNLENMGLTHAYFFDDRSDIEQIFCFQKENDISGIVYANDSKNNNISPALKGLAFVLLERIKNQDYIFEFLKK